MTLWRALLGVIATAGLIAVADVAMRGTTLPGGRYGEVHVSKPAGGMRGLVVLFSDLSGWSDADRRAASLLARHDLLVVGVDSAQYASTLAGTTEACHHLVDDAEAISHQLQREQRSATYFTPIMAGIGQGGVVAEQVLAAAASNTIAGAISIDPASTLDVRFRPCPPDPTILHDIGLPGFWSIGYTEGLPAATQTAVASLRHGDAKVDMCRFTPGTAESEMLLALVQPHLESRENGDEEESDLPLVELPAAHSSNMLAIVISGDGGWRDLDKTIAYNLRDQDVSVVGLDSLRYFWSGKSPEQTAHDLTRIIQTYSARWHAASLALIGYSFGADVLPFAYRRLPQAARDKISMISLLGFAGDADFEIRVTGWLGMPASNKALPAAPEIAKVPPRLVQCLYGEHEEDTICPAMAKTGIEVIRTAGGHHFGRDYGDLARTILNGWRRRMKIG